MQAETTLVYDDCGRVVVSYKHGGYWTVREYEPRRADGSFSTIPLSVTHKYSHLYEQANPHSILLRQYLKENPTRARELFDRIKPSRNGGPSVSEVFDTQHTQTNPISANVNQKQPKQS